MEQKVDTKKKAFNKAQYPKTIDTQFKELGTTTISQDIQNQPTVDEFFVLYNELFYDIPPSGEINSHEYLIQQSSEYINYEQNLEEIQALQDEISSLRQELLDTQVQLAGATGRIQITGSLT